jgi:hypothetical protein
MSRCARFYLNVCMFAVVTFELVSCGKPNDTNAGGGMRQASGMEKAAQENALAEIKKNWVKQSDGWITARDIGTSFAPVRFLRQCRDLIAEGVRTDDLTESDRMNGFEWSGEVRFKQTPCREAGDQGILLDGMANMTVFRQRGHWTQWSILRLSP